MLKTEMDRVTFIVAEKSYLVRKGIVSIINRTDHATVVKELSSLDTINSVILKYNPDFLVFNPNLIPSRFNYRNFTLKINLAKKGVAIITTGPVRRGLIGNIRETIGLNEEREVIISKFENLVEPAVAARNNGMNAELSDREKTILKMIARGLTNKEIAEKLFLSAHTVITHRKNITNKLGIKTISGLTVYAILNNLVTMEEIS